MKSIGKLALVILILVVGIWIFVDFYPYIFKKRVDGEVLSVERVMDNQMIISGSRGVNPQIFSVAVAIKDQKTREIHTASSEDRQWASATAELINKGICAEADMFPYPPWQLNRSGTYYGARLIKLYECGKTSR
ncbi:MAG: hypothetical protein V4736_03300 [Bdellovibrionota bacterium]